MKIMTFNVQHCMNYTTREIDYELFGRTLRESGADVVGINEIYSGGEESCYGNQVARLAERGGYGYSFFAKAILVKGISPYGNALLSKVPVVEARVIPIPDPTIRREGGHGYETRCLLKARLENGLCVMVLHMGLNPEEQENALRVVLENLEDKRCVLMGDFNVTPDHPLIRAIAERMNDTSACVTQPLLSFPSDAPDCKIDYIFASRDLEILSADIPSVVASDHRPHTAEIELPNA